MESVSMKLNYKGPVQAVILDWAGTGVDFGCFGPVRPIIKAFAEQGICLETQEARGPMGLAKKDHIRALLNMPSIAERWFGVHGRAPGEKEVDQVFLLAEKYMMSAVEFYSKPTPGAVEALGQFRKMGLKIGSTTGYTRGMTDVLTRQAAEYEYCVDCVCTADDVYGQGRPYPFMIYKNAIKLGVYPMQAIVKIGDTPVDIIEGLNAGCWTIGLTGSSSLLGLSPEELAALPEAEREHLIASAENQLKQAGAHFIAPGLAQCPAIVEQISRIMQT